MTLHFYLDQYHSMSGTIPYRNDTIYCTTVLPDYIAILVRYGRVPIARYQ